MWNVVVRMPGGDKKTLICDDIMCKESFIQLKNVKDNWPKTLYIPLHTVIYWYPDNET